MNNYKIDFDDMRKCLNKFHRYTVNLVEGFPDDWKQAADYFVKCLSCSVCNRFVHCLVFNDVQYDSPKLIIVLIDKNSTERPFSYREVGCIYHTSNEPNNGKDVAQSFKLYRPFTTYEKKYMWETKRVRVN